MSGDPIENAHPKFQIRFRPDGIVHLVFSAGVSIGFEEATAATEAMAESFGGRRYPLLVDTRDLGPLYRAARTEFVRRGELVSAVALIVSSPLSRIMGNFFVNAHQAVAPTRLFDDEESAVAWLQEFNL